VDKVYAIGDITGICKKCSPPADVTVRESVHHAGRLFSACPDKVLELVSSFLSLFL
jgi:hypothetical protein